MQNTPFAQQQRQVNAFLDKTRQLGAQMDSQQGTTRIIYDTTGSTFGQNNFTFFTEVASKTFPATNIDNNRFQPGEGMVIKEIGLRNLINVQGQPLFNKNGTMFSILDFTIGNNRVIKSLPLSAFSTIAGLNPLNTGSNSSNDAFSFSGTVIRLRTNIIIPPLVQFSATLRTPINLGNDEEPINLKLFLKGYGKLFNPGQNF
jgi:hypothetical protein